MTASQSGKYRKAAASVSAAVLLAIGCGAFAPPASAQSDSPSLSDRFKSWFGGASKDAPIVDPQGPAPELNCPPVSIRAGASTYLVGTPGKEAVGNDVRFQASITKTARDCTLENGQITARIGIQGRVIAGPAGAPETIEVPMRVAVVQGGVSEKTVATKAYRTTVTMSEAGSTPFTIIADDVVYPAPPVAIGDSYIFYIGFDPQALTPEPKPKAARKKK
ncbi:MAG TPA: hypothetical protein VG387_11930 [Rhizomicrobium sp.]|nr:hypothetical protein [Rhizomicrobium sp.]